MPRELRNLDDLSFNEREKAQRAPGIKQRMQVMYIIAFAFVMACVMYGVIFAMGLLGPAQEGDAVIWQGLCGMAFVTTAAMVVVMGIRLKQLRALTDFAKIAEEGNTTLVIGMAMTESIAIYGLIGPFLAMPAKVSYGLMAVGFVETLIAALYLLGQIRARLIIAVALENREQAEAAQGE